MAKLTDRLLSHRLTVVAFWLGVLVAGAVLVPSIVERMSQDFSLPGEPGYEANVAITQLYRGGSQPPLVAVVTLPARSSFAADRPQLARAFGAAARALGGPVAWYGNTSESRLLVGRVAVGLLFPPGGARSFDLSDDSDQVSAAMEPALPAGAELEVTGIAPLSHSGGGGGAGVVGLTLVGAALALLVLGFVFGSLLALAPLLIAAVAILATFLALGAVVQVATVSVFVEYIVALLGLGLAIDYSLLIATRWREELHQGRDNDEAVRKAMGTAGRSVLLSGLTVTVGLLSMVVLPVPFLRSIGYAGMLIPLISSLVAITLMPVVLSAVGPWLDWPHLRSERKPGRGWSAWARAVVRWRWPAIAAGLASVAALAAFAPALNAGTPTTASLARPGPAYQALASLRAAGVPAGALSPIEILLPATTDPANAVARLAATTGVWSAFAPTGPGWRPHATVLAIALPSAEPATAQGQATLTRVRRLASTSLPGSRVGGSAAQNADFGHAVYGRFPLMLAVIALITLALLTRTFRSLALALKSVALSLASIAAALGATVLIWQDGDGSHLIWGIPASGAINALIPVIVFAFLFGLSTDYEVFLISRIREEYDRSGSTARAAFDGTARTGRLITSAALILFFAFAALAAGPNTQNKMFASALAIGILLDATIVRAVLVPALVAALDRRAWWLPRHATRLLRLRPPSQAASPRPTAAIGPAGRERVAPGVDPRE